MHNDRLLRLRDVEAKIGLGKSWIYGQIRLKQFPAAIRLNGRHVAWLESEVDAWIRQRIRMTRNGERPPEALAISGEKSI